MSKIIPYDHTLTLGRGYNTLNGETVGSVFLNPQWEESLAANGQEVDFFMKRIDSSESMHESLEISVGVDGNYGPFFSMEGNFQNSAASSYNSHSIFYLVRIKVRNASRHMTTASMEVRPEVIQLLKDGETPRFSEFAGDSFVSGLITGGEFYALYEIVTTDKTHNAQTKGSLEMSIGTFVAGVDIKVSFATALQEISKTCTVNLTIHQLGGKGNTAKPPENIDEIKNRAKEFPTIVEGDGAIMYNVILDSYKSLLLPKGPNYVELENKKAMLAEYAKDIMEARQNLSDLKYIINHPNEFYKKGADGKQIEFTSNPESIGKLNSQIDAMNDYIKEYFTIAKNIANSPGAVDRIFPKSKPDLADLPLRKDNLDAVILFCDKDFKGKGTYLAIGEYANSNEFHLPDNSIASIIIPEQLRVYVCREPNFISENNSDSGWCTIKTSISDIEKSDIPLIPSFYKSISSIIVTDVNAPLPDKLQKEKPKAIVEGENNKSNDFHISRYVLQEKLPERVVSTRRFKKSND